VDSVADSSTNLLLNSTTLKNRENSNQNPFQTGG